MSAFPNWTDYTTWKLALTVAAGAMAAVADIPSLPAAVHLVAAIGAVACSGGAGAVILHNATSAGPTVVQPDPPVTK